MEIQNILNPIRKHPGLSAGIVLALGVLWLLPTGLPDIVRGVVTWDTFAGVTLAVAWTLMLSSGHADIRDRAAHYDANDMVILGICVVAVVVSLVAIMALMLGIGNFPPEAKAFRLSLAVATVSGSWLFLHTLLALHYAHAYYWPKQDASGHAGGLEFPGGETPDYLDFLYFAFVLGATAQTSDVAVTSKPIRRMVMLHGTLSFAFNTLLLALTVNVAATVF